MFGGQSNLCSSTHDFRVQADGVAICGVVNALQRAFKVETGVEQGAEQTKHVHTWHGSRHHHLRLKISLQLSAESIDFCRDLKCKGKLMG
ncbi:unnamed protein product [Prunus armeniaca]